MTARATAVLLALCAAACATSANANAILFERATFKVTKVEHGEKVSRVRVTTDAHSVHEIGHADGLEVDADDTLSVQAAFVLGDDGDGDGDGEGGGAAFPEQAFVRVSGVASGRDTLFALARKGLDMRLDIPLRREIRADPAFWGGDDALRVELVMGDARLAHSRSWTVTERLSVRGRGSGDGAFAPRARGVFDFDVGVRREPQAEFETALPAAEKRAATPVVVGGLAAVSAPIAGLAVAWGNMGVLSATARAMHAKDGGERLVTLGLQGCVGVHAVALVLFWVRWNIVTTLKVMAGAMVPTVVLGRAVAAARRRA